VKENELAVTIIALIVLSGVGLMVAAMMNRRRFRELEHRERLAMIERGLAPSPESDPAGFEARMGGAPHDTGTRYRTAGVLMIGLGLGLLVLLTFAAHEPMVGIGIGGGWAVLGAASLYNYFLIAKRHAAPSERRWTAPGSVGGSEPRSPGSFQ
jgi:hypothetical protein